MDLRLEGKRALVTGSSSGIGEAIAKTLAREGVSVVVHGRNERRAAQVAAEIEAAGGTTCVVLGDLSLDDSARSVAEAALSALDGIDILVNNAGVGGPQRSWFETPATQWAQLFSHDVLSMVRLVQVLAPPMCKRGWGRVIQVASSAATQPLAEAPDYSAAKAATANLSVSLSKALANTGVTANTISPGGIRTAGFEWVWRDIARQRGWGDEWTEIERRIVTDVLRNPTGRVGHVDEVASLVALVASPLGGYINGANLRIDGGYVTGI
jgi:3-oxoacyl-[acyl-carrier protein] reductase